MRQDDGDDDDCHIRLSYFSRPTASRQPAEKPRYRHLVIAANMREAARWARCTGRR